MPEDILSPWPLQASREPLRSEMGQPSDTRVIDKRRVRFLMCLSLLGAFARLEWDVDLTYRLVDSALLRRSFEAIREQVGLQRK